ncbi:MAG: class I SAM-dependent methyltransferase [Longimicrobiales bacterium]
MGAAEHLQIDVAEFDARIRTFIPSYDELIRTAADAVRLIETPSPTIVDLGVGTGALAARCLELHAAARLIGIDSDTDMLEAARVRLAGHPRVELVRGSFLEVALPACDAVVASLALHHVPTAEAKRAFYASCRAALRPGGVLVSADCFPAREPRLATRQRAAWMAHLLRTYTPAQAEGYFAAWAGEDVYVALEVELQWLRDAGLLPEVVWRKGSFAVIAAFRPPAESAGAR